MYTHLFDIYSIFFVEEYKGLYPAWAPAEQHWNLAKIVEHKKKIKKLQMHNFVKWVPWMLQLFKVRYYDHILYHWFYSIFRII